MSASFCMFGEAARAGMQALSTCGVPPQHPPWGVRVPWGYPQASLAPPLPPALLRMQPCWTSLTGMAQVAAPALPPLHPLPPPSPPLDPRLAGSQ